MCSVKSSDSQSFIVRLETHRSLAQILRSRGIGARVGTLIGCGWLISGLYDLPNTIRIPLGLLGLATVVPLLRGSRRLIILARSLPAPDAAALAANRRTWTLFWINLGVEIVLINLALVLLSRPALQPYWVPAISFVVGLHFLPMASFFAVPSYWGGGAAMIGTAAAISLAMRSAVVAPPLLIAGEAVGNAVILWSMAAWGLRTAAHLTTRSSEPALRSGR